MARRANVIRPTQLALMLPEDMRGWLDLRLFSEVEGKVPRGAYQSFFLRKINEEKTWTRLDLEPFGLPAGFFVCGPKLMLEKLQAHLLSTSHRKTKDEY